MSYKSKYYGHQIDKAIGAVLEKESAWDGKQPKLTGEQGQVVGFDASGNAVAQNPQGGGEGSTGPQGPAGQDGEDGFSPIVSIEEIPGGHRVTITDANGPQSFDVMDGQDGAGGGSSSNVSSFNGRTGAVTPQEGDYTAAMVGARPDTWMPTAAQTGAVPAGDVTAMRVLTEEQYTALSSKGASTLYLIKE